MNPSKTYIFCWLSLNQQHLGGRKYLQCEALIGACSWLHSAGKRQKKSNPKTEETRENKRRNNSSKPSDCEHHAKMPKILGEVSAVTFQRRKTLGLKYSKSTWKSESLFCWHWAVTQWCTPPSACKQYFVLGALFRAVHCSTWAVLGQEKHVALSHRVLAEPVQDGAEQGWLANSLQTLLEQIPGAEKRFCPGLSSLFSWDMIPKDQRGGLGERWAIC